MTRFAHSPGSTARVAGRRRMRGAAALAVAMALLFVMTLIVFFVNRGLLFEQRTSANQFRSTRAFEVAEAGLEWAAALLNDARTIDGACAPAPGQPDSFRSLYVPATGSPVDLTPPASARAGCRIGTGSFACSCPAPGTAPDLGTSTDPSFTVEFADEPADPGAVRLTAYGCINQSAACGPGATAGADATATVHVTLKLRPLLRAVPATTLTAGASARVCGAMAIDSDATATHRFLVHAGQGIQIGEIGQPTSYVSGSVASGSCAPGTPSLGVPPGTPLENVLQPSDSTLVTDAAQLDTWFRAFLAMPSDAFRASAVTYTVSGADPASRYADLLAGYAAGYRAFWIAQDIDLSGSNALGSPTDPVVIVAAGSLAISGNPIVHGLIVADTADWNAPVAATVEILRGAALVRQHFANSGGGRLVYDPTVLARLRDMGVLARVPGSWRDIP